MGYASNKAPGRDSLSQRNNPVADERSDVKLGGKASRQEQATSAGTRKVAVPTGKTAGTGYMSTQRDTGTVVRVGPNTKGTGMLKEPSAVALGSKARTYAAVTNPDPVKNRAGNNKAPRKK